MTIISKRIPYGIIGMRERIKGKSPSTSRAENLNSFLAISHPIEVSVRQLYTHVRCTMKILLMRREQLRNCESRTRSDIPNNSQRAKKTQIEWSRRAGIVLWIGHASNTSLDYEFSARLVFKDFDAVWKSAHIKHDFCYRLFPIVCAGSSLKILLLCFSVFVTHNS